MLKKFLKFIWVKYCQKSIKHQTVDQLHWELAGKLASKFYYTTMTQLKTDSPSMLWPLTSRLHYNLWHREVKTKSIQTLVMVWLEALSVMTFETLSSLEVTMLLSSGVEAWKNL